MANADNNISIPSRMGNRKKSLPPESELIAEANRLFRYDAPTGNLIWVQPKDRVHPGKCKIGSIVGGNDGHGYRKCRLLCHTFKVHQVVWMMCKNEFPKMPIDHINRDILDNRIENLRVVTDQQNQFNQKSIAREFSGVCKVKNKPNKFDAKIQVKGRKIYLGRFKSKEEANAAYVTASKKIRGEYSAA